MKLPKRFIFFLLLSVGCAGCGNGEYPLATAQVSYLPCEKYEADTSLSFTFQIHDTPLKFSSTFYYKRIFGPVPEENRSISYSRSISSGNLLSGYFIQVKNGISGRQNVPIEIKAKYLDLAAHSPIDLQIDQILLLPVGKIHSKEAGKISMRAKWKHIWNHEVSD